MKILTKKDVFILAVLIIVSIFFFSEVFKVVQAVKPGFLAAITQNNSSLGLIQSMKERFFSQLGYVEIKVVDENGKPYNNARVYIYGAADNAIKGGGSMPAVGRRFLMIKGGYEARVDTKGYAKTVTPFKIGGDQEVTRLVIQLVTLTQFDLGRKIYILENGDPKEKIDILFIPAHVTNASIKMKDYIEEIVRRDGYDINGQPIVNLFNVEPLKSYKSKFNIAYIDKNIDEGFFECIKENSYSTGPPKLNYLFICNAGKIKKAYKIFQPDFIAVAFDYPGYSASASEIQYLNVRKGGNKNSGVIGWTFVHEFGHQLGLTDEYSGNQSPSYRCGNFPQEVYFSRCVKGYADAIKMYPNVDVLGCPKWCGSYDPSKLKKMNQFCSQFRAEKDCSNTFGECTWFASKHPWFDSQCVITDGGGFGNVGIDCQGGNSCVFGGDRGQFAFNPGTESIMSAGGRKFNQPSQAHIKNILECCYPRKDNDACNAFRARFNPLLIPNLLDDSLRTAYNKIVTCE